MLLQQFGGALERVAVFEWQFTVDVGDTLQNDGGIDFRAMVFFKVNHFVAELHRVPDQRADFIVTRHRHGGAIGEADNQGRQHGGRVVLVGTRAADTASCHVGKNPSTDK